MSLGFPCMTRLANYRTLLRTEVRAPLVEIDKLAVMEEKSGDLGLLMNPRTPERIAPALLALRWLVIALGGAALLFAAGCEKKPPSAPTPPEVQVFTVKEQDVPIYHDWIGTLDGLVNAQIRAQVTGYLLKQNYREGEFVKMGDVLFQIDDRPFQA